MYNAIPASVTNKFNTYAALFNYPSKKALFLEIALQNIFSV
jgi:hypothetical protein